MITAGTPVSFQLSGQVRIGVFTPWTDAEDVRAGIINAMTPNLRIYSVTVRPTSFVAVGALDWSYTASVVVASKVDHGMVDDIGSIVANAFWQVTGDVPTYGAGQVVPVPIAQPEPTGGVQQPDIDIPGINLGAFGAGLQSILSNTLMIVIIGAIIVGVVVLKD
jgi:hypothetical protein